MEYKGFVDEVGQQLCGVVNSLQEASQTEAARHLRKSGCELLRALRASLEAVIDLLEPEPGPKTDKGCGSEVE